MNGRGGGGGGDRDRDSYRGDRDRDGGRDEGQGTGFRRGRRRGCGFCADDAPPIDYKDPQALRYFITDRGKVVPRRISGSCAKHQRELTLAIKRSRNIALLPFTAND
jgi:small subunit ribosomal protein S18